jgi:isopropylmalate/homocitrate/citramalate synthase
MAERPTGVEIDSQTLRRIELEEHKGVDYIWSRHEGPDKPVRSVVPHVEIDDETLRDGLQGAQLEQHPTREGKLSYLSHASKFVDHADIGFPGSEETHRKEIEEIIKLMENRGINISVSGAGRAAADSDIRPIIDISHNLDGYPIEADIFFDSSNIRAHVQHWNRDEMLSKVRQNIELLKQQNLPIMYVFERATSTPPEEMSDVLEIVADLGVDRIGIADTQGIANDEAIKNIFRWFSEQIESNNPEIMLDVHFHNDRGFAGQNTIIAAREGANRVHVTSLCIGERAGNADLAQVAKNLQLEGYRNNNLVELWDASQDISRILKFPIPVNAPVIGRDAHTTASGVHASAHLRELELDDGNKIYHAYDPASVGAKPGVEVGPSSGDSNVVIKLRELGIEPTPEKVAAILAEAKAGRGLLSSRYIQEIARSLE